MYYERLYLTLLELLRLPSTSGHEELVRAYLEQQLTELGLTPHVDSMGNLIATVSGTGSPLLLNAHMDRVPPGLGHEPILRDGILYSDGNTNLGADDAAGITIILETLHRLHEQQLTHPPLVIVFTVQEETGLCGARSFESPQWDAKAGIVFDNAFEAGAVVSAGAAYESFDIKITGSTGHPGKDLSHTIDAIEIFRAARYPYGSLANDRTRISIGRIKGGSARNAIADTVILEGELRSFEPPEVRTLYKQLISDAFMQAAQRFGGHCELSFTTHATGYTVDPEEPLLRLYTQTLATRGSSLHLRPTFIGSDASGFRPKIATFVISTGVANEHSVDEYVALAPLETLVQDTLHLLDLWAKRAEKE